MLEVIGMKSSIGGASNGATMTDERAGGLADGAKAMLDARRLRLRQGRSCSEPQKVEPVS